jgi:sugar phosphate isomerase/epimerase
MTLTRRTFLAGAAAAPLAMGANGPTLAVFSKPLQNLKPDALGKALRQAGADAVDLTVRPAGHVLPESVREDLPRAFETLRSTGVSVPMITTALTSASDPAARPLLSTAARLKIPYFKLGYWRYRDGDIEQTLNQVKQDVRGLVDLGREFGIQAGWHNHAGDYVGMAVWDTRSIIADMDPKWIGYYYDTSHATSEGGVAGWEIALRLALPRLKMVAAKDHVWEKARGKWTKRTVPLGEGMVNLAKMLSMLARARYSGVISLHVEYETPDAQAAIARDLQYLKRQVAEAYAARS